MQKVVFMERFVASKGQLPSWAAKIRVKSPKRLTVIAYSANSKGRLKTRPESQQPDDNAATWSHGWIRHGFFEG
jgi:hypothetical protein